MTSALRIGFLGAGRMATALAAGFVKAGLVTPADVVASDVSEEARRRFASEVGCETVRRNFEVLNASAVVVLAVKPQQVTEVLSDVQDYFTARHLMISIAAGVPLKRLEMLLGVEPRVVRVMPNTPALVGASASGFARGQYATDEDAQLVKRLLEAIGLAFEVKEELLDAVTGLSGSGPAFVFMTIEALSDGGVAAGLSRDVALKLAAQTVLGSARLVLETGRHPGALKDMVTSPAGTTIEGVHELERAGIRAAFMNAVRAAARRSRELGGG